MDDKNYSLGSVAQSSLQELRQNTTLAINERIVNSPYSNLDDYDDTSFVRKPATVSDPTNIARSRERVRSSGLLALARSNNNTISNFDNSGNHKSGSNIGCVDVHNNNSNAIANTSNSNGDSFVDVNIINETVIKYSGNTQQGHTTDNTSNPHSNFNSKALLINSPKSNHLTEMFTREATTLIHPDGKPTKLYSIMENAAKWKETVMEFANTNTQKISKSLSKRYLKQKYTDIPLHHNHHHHHHHHHHDQRENPILQEGHSNQDNPEVMHHNEHIPHNYPFEKSIPPHAHFRSFQKTTPPTPQTNHYTSTIQNVVMDALSPCVVGATNVRFVTTQEREVRDRQVTRALNMISQSVEPPEHNVDRFKDWLLDSLRDDSKGENDQLYAYYTANFLLGWPLWITRQIWNYVVLQIHLIYNLALLYASFFVTPMILFFVVGFSMFWIKIIYELYRDIMHRDDPIYHSNIPREMSFAAAISASFGFVLKVKAESGDLTDAWWRNKTY